MLTLKCIQKKIANLVLARGWHFRKRHDFLQLDSARKSSFSPFQLQLQEISTPNLT